MSFIIARDAVPEIGLINAIGRISVDKLNLVSIPSNGENIKVINPLSIIKFTAKTILKVMHHYKLEDSFIGHIGGDDFVGIISDIDYEKLCQDIIIKFDQNIKTYFNEEDIERGYLEVANRKGIIEQFPLTSLSIGVVTVEPGEYDNPLEIGEIGAQIKHLAKTQPGSAYAINRRKN